MVGGGRDGSQRMLLGEEHQGVLWLTLNRPQVRNALNGELRAGLLGELSGVASSASVRAVVLRGAPGAFCSGADVAEMAQGMTGTVAMLDLGREIVMAIANLPKPVIAAVQGVAAGAGFSLALSCDLVVADPTALFRPIFVERGLAPDWGCSHWLVRHLGLARAKDVLLTGRSLSAVEAHELGIVARLWDADEFAERLRAFADQLASGPTVALGITKRTLNRAAESDLHGVLAMETYGQAFATSTFDHAEAVRAFSERRPAAFEGR